MPFLRPLRLGSSYSDTYKGTQPTLLMRNPFLVFRLVFLALMFNYALISLIFAAWNINASVAYGAPTYTSAVFIVFQSCLTFFGLILALADLLYDKAHTARTLVECTWVAVLTIFQMGAAIGAVIAAQAAHTICISASLLVPITWLGAFIYMSYFLAVFVATMCHKAIYPDIWKRTIYSIQWFDAAAPEPLVEKGTRHSYTGSTFDEYDVFAAFYHDPEAPGNRQARDTSLDPAPWAVPGRRGIDHPFQRNPAQPWRLSPTTTTSPAPPQLPPKDLVLPLLPAFPGRSADPFASMFSVPPPASGSRFVEKFRESSVLARGESPEEFAKRYHARTSSFPLSVLDLDQPIPLTKLSEWVKVNDKGRYDVPRGTLFS